VNKANVGQKRWLEATAPLTGWATLCRSTRRSLLAFHLIALSLGPGDLVTTHWKAKGLAGFFREGMRLMKPFGVRLAAGAVTILLGALAAAQAQKDQQNKSQSQWSLSQTPSLAEPPAPIEPPAHGVDELSSWPVSDPIGNAPQGQDLDSAVDSQWDAASSIQLVQHSQPITTPSDTHSAAFQVESAPSTAMGFAMVDSATGEVLPSGSTSGPAIGFPASGAAAASADPVASMSLPAMTMTLPETPDSFTAPPSQFDQPPGMNFADAPPPGDWSQGVDDQEGWPQEDPRDFAQQGPVNDLRGQDTFGSETFGDAEDDDPAESAFGDAPPSFGMQPVSPSDQGLPSADMNTDMNAPASFAGAPQALLRAVPGADEPALDAQSSPLGLDMGEPTSQPRFVDPVAASSSQPTLRYAETPPAASPERHPPPNMIHPDATISAPGDRRLEGIQTPSIVIHKRAPSEVKVGKPASFVIHVKNVGTAEALEVTVHDRVPAGMRLIDASPSPIQQADRLLWQLGAVSAGDERTITMQLVPEQEGELGSVARVTFEAAASVRTIATRPELRIVQKGPPKVLIGQQLEIELEVSNPGTGDATGVVLQEDVPEGLEHPKGRHLDNLLGTLVAGEVRHQVLRLRAVAPGIIQNEIRLTGDDGLEAIDVIEVEVIAPQLQVSLNGPQRRFLERQATYDVDIANVGSAAATNVEIVAHLDRGFTFISTDYEGQYDPNQHAVFWSLASLPEGGSGTVPLTLLPVKEGEQAIRLEAHADLGVVAKNERKLVVDSLAELTFSINDVSDPIELGSETVYEIHLSNSGSRPDTNVKVQLQLPSGMKLLGADGDAQEDGRGGVFFPPLNQLATNSKRTYRVRAQGTQVGTHLVKAVVTSDQSTTPVTKEESTMVYADR